MYNNYEAIRLCGFEYKYCSGNCNDCSLRKESVVATDHTTPYASSNYSITSTASIPKGRNPYEI